MKTITLYIAYDDTEFTDENECRIHELKAYEYINELMNNYTFYDKAKNIIFPAYDSIEEFFQWFEFIIDEECEYITVYKDLSREAHKFLWRNIGACIPEKVGFYKYDWHKCEWVSTD